MKKITEPVYMVDKSLSRKAGGAWIIHLNDFGKLKSDIQKYIYEDIK